MNIGIIGYGIMGQIRADAICKLNPDYDGRLKTILISEPKDFSPEDIPAKFSVQKGVQFTKINEDIVNSSEIDVVFICVPNYLSKDLVIQCLDAGKHVFCEKPPGMNLAEIDEMIEAEKRNPGKKLMFGFNHRHHDSMLHAKEFIESGQMGKVLWVRGRYGKSVDENYHKTWRAQKKYSGGGIFLDQGLHMLDLCLMMCGDFDTVKAEISNLYWGLDVEDNVFAIFKNSKGQVASLHSTMTQWRHLFSLEIFLEKGHIVLNGLLTNSGSYGKETMTIAENSAGGPAIAWDKEVTTTYKINTSWKNEMKLFFDSVIRDFPVPMGNSSDARKLMRLVDMVYEQSN